MPKAISGTGGRICRRDGRGGGPEAPALKRRLSPRTVRFGFSRIPTGGGDGGSAEGAPRSFNWRKTRYRVARAEGPERIAAEWVDRRENHPTRDLFPDRGIRRAAASGCFAKAFTKGDASPAGSCTEFSHERGYCLLRARCAHNFSFLEGARRPKRWSSSPRRRGLPVSHCRPQQASPASSGPMPRRRWRLTLPAGRRLFCRRHAGHSRLSEKQAGLGGHLAAC